MGSWAACTIHIGCVSNHFLQAVENSALEDFFTRMSPGTLYAKVTSSGKPKDTPKDSEDLEYYL